MAAYRTLIWDAILVKLRRKILHLTDTGFYRLKLGILVQTHSKSRHVTAIHATVCKKSLERNAESLCSLIPVLVARSDESSHVYETVLLGRHCHAVCV